jgi:prepilin-type N-terminal cleavage/methylation domain-containing protein
MTSRLQRRHDDAGFSLIELMVVVMLTAVIGGVVSVSLITGMRSTRQDQSRGNASNAVQLMVEQISRDVRVADPLRSVSTTDIVVDRYLGAICQRIEWRVTSSSLQRRVQVFNAPNANTSDSTNGCYNYASPPAALTDTGFKTMMSRLTSATPFSALTAAGATASTAAATHQLAITLSQSLPQNRAGISYSTSVTLRNAT